MTGKPMISKIEFSKLILAFLFLLPPEEPNI